MSCNFLTQLLAGGSHGERSLSGGEGWWPDSPLSPRALWLLHQYHICWVTHFSACWYLWSWDVSCCHWHPPIIAGHVFPHFNISEVRVDFPDSRNPATFSELEHSAPKPPWMPNSWPGAVGTDFSLQPWAFWNCFLKSCLYNLQYSYHSLFVLFIAEQTVGWVVGENWVLSANTGLQFGFFYH